MFDELFELNMSSLAWTQIEVYVTKPQKGYMCTLNAVSDWKLLLYGGNTAERLFTSDTWILDLPSQTWSPYTSGVDSARCGHTSTVYSEGCIMITGGSNDSTNSDDVADYRNDDDYTTCFHVNLEPRSLQQLATCIIYKNRAVLPLVSLPKKLIAYLGIKDNQSTSIKQQKQPTKPNCL